MPQQPHLDSVNVVHHQAYAHSAAHTTWEQVRLPVYSKQAREVLCWQADVVFCAVHQAPYEWALRSAYNLKPDYELLSLLCSCVPRP